MKFYVPLCVFITFLASAQQKAPKGYAVAPSLSITGDFNGDGNQDTLSQFVTDSLGNHLEYILDTDDWETTIPLYIREGYKNVFFYNNSPQTSLSYYPAVGLSCLINLGDINTTPGDEIALVPFLYDFSNLNTCHIYSYCNDTWKEAFSFRVNETAFFYTGDTEPIFTNIPGFLEWQNDKWVYIDYMEWLNADDPIMKPLKVPSCN